MSVKVAINGFGRIGRLAFRQMFGAEGFEVVAINDLTSPKMLAHLLKYDSTQGAYAKPFGTHTVEAGEDNIVVDGKKITIYAKANAAELPWGELGVDVVLECTGFYTSKAKAQADKEAFLMKEIIDFMEENVDGRTLFTKELVYELENGALQGVYSDQISFSNLKYSQSGFQLGIHVSL